MKTTLAAMLLVAGLIGCSSTSDSNKDMMAGDEDTPMSRGGPHDDWTRLQDDPVCGHSVNPKTAYSESYSNQTYYFDTEECAKKFKDNPTAFLPGFVAKDPVCGHEVDPKTAMWTGEYDHKKYYFDTEECAQKFKDNPHAFMPGGDDRPGYKEAR